MSDDEIETRGRVRSLVDGWLDSIDRIELIATVVLALAVIATAWSGFQSAKWSGNQAILFSEASAARAESTRPDGVMIQETDYLNALGRVTAFTTTLTGLELLDADRTPVAEYRFGGRVRDAASGATDPKLHHQPKPAVICLVNRGFPRMPGKAM